MPFEPVLPEDLSRVPVNLHFVSGRKPDSISRVGVKFYEGGAQVHEEFMDVPSQTEDEAYGLIKYGLAEAIRRYYHLPAPVVVPNPPQESEPDAKEETSPDDGNRVEALDKSGRPTRVPNHGRKQVKTSPLD